MNLAMNKDDEIEYSFGGRWLAPLWRFLSQFVRDTNPTLDWTRDPGLELVLDLDNNTLSGIHFGVSYKECSRFGPCSQFTQLECVECCDEEGCKIVIDDADASRSYSFDYSPEGFGFGTDDQWCIDSFHVYFQPDPDRPKSRTYCGKLIWQGQALKLTAISDFESLVRVFGAPAFDSAEHGIEYDSEHSRMLNYERPNGSWLIFLDKAARTRSFFVSAHVWPSSIDADEAPKVE